MSDRSMTSNEKSYCACGHPDAAAEHICYVTWKRQKYEIERLRASLVFVQECISHQDFMQVRRVVAAALSGDSCAPKPIPPDKLPRLEFGTFCGYCKRNKITLGLNPSTQYSSVGSSGETKAPQAPIARIKIEETGWEHDLETVKVYAPGLPPGEYDVYLDPSAPGLTQETSVPSPRFAGLTGEVRAPKAGDKCNHCGREWLAAPHGGQGVYHECHFGPSQKAKGD